MPEKPGIGHRASGIVFSAVIATAAQLAPLVAGKGPYIANEDERFYYAAFAGAAREPLGVTNPFDREWADAAPAGIRLLALALAVPVKLGVDEELVWDGARWLGNFSSTALLVAIGSRIATPALGAAAAVLIQLDPGAFYGKPFLSLAGIGVHHEDDPHQLVTSRSMVSALTLPFLLLCVLGTIRLARRNASALRRRFQFGASTLLIGLAGFSGHLFTWAGVLAGSAAAALLHPRRRRMLLPVFIGGVLAGVLVLAGGLGRHGTSLEEIIMRLGAIRTHRPQFLTHAGFWGAALAASVLVFTRLRFCSAAVAVGAMYIGAWALSMLHTPVLGWDVESYHFAHVMAPLGVLVWLTLAWHLWHHRRRRQPMLKLLLFPAGLAFCLVAFRGPIFAMRGLGASIAESGDARGEMIAWLERGAIPAGHVVTAARPYQMALATAYDGIMFAAPYQMMWSIPDTVIFHRSVCASVLSGADSAAVTREALKPRPGSIAVYHDGRPAGIPLEGVRVYFDIFPRLAAALGSAVAEAHRSPQALRASCYERPDYALAIGKQHVRRALAAATALGGGAHWMASDSGAAWTSLRPAQASGLRPD